MNKQYNKLLKTSIIYAIGQIVGQLLNFFLIPIYTNKLGAIEYGKYSTITAFSGFISTFLILSIYSGFYRFYKEAEDSEEENLMINTALNFAYIMGFITIVFVFTIGNYISKLIFKFDNGLEILWIVIVSSVISQISTIYTSKYSLHYEAFKVSTINIIKLILQFGITVFFVINLNKGIIGVLYGQLVSNLIIYIYLIIIEMREYRLIMSYSMLKDMLIFSCGLLPVNISGWVLQLSDRYFLSNYCSFKEAGIYNLAYQIGMIINPLFIIPFLNSYKVYALEIYKEIEAKETFKFLFRKYDAIGCFMILVISMYSKGIIYLLANKDFLLGYAVVPLIAYSYFLYGKVVYYGFGLQIKNKTYKEGIYMTVSSIINIGFNFLIIPKYGMIGAAISTVISYFILNIILIISSNKEYEINIDIKYTTSIQLITLIFYICYYVISINCTSIVKEILSSTILLMIYLFVVIKLKLVTLEFLIGQLKNIKAKLCS